MQNITFDGLYAAGKYRWKNPHITAELLKLNILAGNIPLWLYQFYPYSLLSWQVQLFLLQENCRPAQPQHLLSFWAQFPSWEKEAPVLALDSDIKAPNKQEYVICTCWDEKDGHGLQLRPKSFTWLPHCWFLALPQQSDPHT